MNETLGYTYQQEQQKGPRIKRLIIRQDDDGPSTIRSRYEAAKRTIDARSDFGFFKWAFFRLRIFVWYLTGNM